MYDDPHLGDRLRLLMALRRSGIQDTAVLSAIESIPREQFVPRMFSNEAYADTALPIESGQTISQPTIVAWMTQSLQVTSRCRVLEIGTGSGYQAAVLSKLARRVYTIERHNELLKMAEQRFQQLRLTNIVPRVGDGGKGWPEAAPFDRIIVTAASPQVPATLLEQMAVGGIMIIPVGDPAGEQVLLKVDKQEDGYSSQQMMRVRFVPLISGKLPA
jgi:protein-L-isoaspartate(D-aspartate) O-methyltransferase